MEASTGNRKIDIELVLAETPDGFELSGKLKVENGKLSAFSFQLSTPKIPATNPEKALENIRKKALQWGDTIYNPVNLEIRFSQPYLIPASVIGEMKRGLLAQMEATKTSLRGALATKQSNQTQTKTVRLDCFGQRPRNDEPDAAPHPPTLTPLTSQFSPLMTCHHCIRYANGMCPKITGKPIGPLFIRNGANTFRLEFDCKKCLMYVCPLE